MKLGLMKIYYIALPKADVEQAEQLSQALLIKHSPTIWSNWFPINGTNPWVGSLENETEIGVLLYTQSGDRENIDKVICEELGKKPYSVAEISPESANKSFLIGLDNAIPRNTLSKSLLRTQ